MPKQSSPWQTVSIHPLITPLDTRGRPADIAAGAVRWKQNLAVTPDGKLCRRPGFDRFFADYGYDSAASQTPSTTGGSVYHNHDFHHQGQSHREPITFQFESSVILSPNPTVATRRYYLGTQSGIWMLDQQKGSYTQVLGNMGAPGTRWHAAELQNKVLFTNNYDRPQLWDVNASHVAEISDLNNALKVSKARVVVQWNGFLFLMNVEQDGTQQGSLALWCDLNNPPSWAPSTQDSCAGFQYLTYGDDIIASAPLLTALYIYTRRSLWRVTVSSNPLAQFDFLCVYNEPKNQSGCLAFPETLVNTGADHYYMGRDGIYRYNPYLAAPQREGEEMDWLYKASGLIYRKIDTQVDGNYCLSPVGEWMPATGEIWWSWPDVLGKGVNNHTLVANTLQKTADVIDHGFTSFVNFRRIPNNAEDCNEVQDFLGASSLDWCIKSIGGVFYREFVRMAASGDKTADISEAGAVYYTTGYTSILRGMIPLGLNDREKKIRNVLIDHDTSEQDTPCVVQLRIGTAFSMVDPNDMDDICAPLWTVIKDVETGKPWKLLECPDQKKISQMQAAGTRPARGMNWRTMRTGRFLFFEISILNQDGSPAIGGDSCWQRIDFEALSMPKP